MRCNKSYKEQEHILPDSILDVIIADSIQTTAFERPTLDVQTNMTFIIMKSPMSHKVSEVCINEQNVFLN